MGFGCGCYPPKWYKDGVQLKDKGDTLKVTKPGDYKVIVPNNVCSDTSMVVSIRNKFIASITKSGDTLFSSKGFSYQWLGSSRKIISDATSSYFIPSCSGTYYVRVTDSSGCTQLSDSIHYVSSLSIHPLNQINSKVLEVFPNPVNSQISIYNKTGQTVLLNIKDVTGRTIISWHLSPSLQAYQLASLGLNIGVYWLQLVYGQFCAVEKIIVINSRL